MDNENNNINGSIEHYPDHDFDGTIYTIGFQFKNMTKKQWELMKNKLEEIIQLEIEDGDLNPDLV